MSQLEKFLHFCLFINLHLFGFRLMRMCRGKLSTTDRLDTQTSSGSRRWCFNITHHSSLKQEVFSFVLPSSYFPHLQVLLTQTHLAIVMEYAAGGELFERICSAGRFSEDEVQSLINLHTIYTYIYTHLHLFQPIFTVYIIGIHLVSHCMAMAGKVFLSAASIGSQLLPFHGTLSIIHLYMFFKWVKYHITTRTLDFLQIATGTLIFQTRLPILSTKVQIFTSTLKHGANPYPR